MDISLSSAGAARTGAGTGTQAGINELDAYRAGGALRTEIPNNPKNVREALLAVIATWSASYIAIAFERDGDLGKMLQKYGGEMDYALVRYTRTEFIVDAYFVTVRCRIMFFVIHIMKLQREGTRVLQLLRW